MFVPPAPIQSLHLHEDYLLEVLRLDLLHPEISGNKWFKLKYNLEQAKVQGYSTIVTFGGAFSNHVAATAAACKLQGFRCIGIIRGEDSKELNPTLVKARQNGMQLHFVSRGDYRNKDSAVFKHELLLRFGPHYLIPEGGSNLEGLKGCMEIVASENDHDYILCACGTGTTFAGIAASVRPFQKVIGINVLKGVNGLPQTVQELLGISFPQRQEQIAGNVILERTFIDQHSIVNTYAFNGYAKFHPQLLAFKHQFEADHQIPLDHVYTVKLFYAAFDLVKQQKLKPGSKVLVIHSGGLQGNAGFEMVNFKLFPSFPSLEP